MLVIALAHLQQRSPGSGLVALLLLERRHLLHFQLIDHLITSVVLDRKPGFQEGLSDTIGVSVGRLVAQFGEQDRAQKAEEDAAVARARAARLQEEKDALEEEISKGGEGMSGGGSSTRSPRMLPNGTDTLEAALPLKLD